MAKPRSLVLITVDCLRADHVGFMGYERPTTPFLDSLASESHIVTNAVVAGAPTYHSFPAIMASRYPLAFGRDVVGISPDEPTIASTLNQMGYATAAFVAGNPYLAKRFGYGTGFDTFEDFLNDESLTPAVDLKPDSHDRLPSRLNKVLSKVSHRLGPMGSIYDELYFRYSQKIASRSAATLDQLRRFPTADVVVGQACQWLQGIADRPFFLWLHLMDPHGPYYPPQAALDLMGYRTTAAAARAMNSNWVRGNVSPRRLEQFRDDAIRLYDCGIRWADHQTSVLVDALRSLGLWNDCVLALTADHGEEFLDHGGTCHPVPKVTEELAHVPLLLRIPGTKPQKLSSPFSLLHLAPTLMEAVQVAVPREFRGKSFWPQIKNGESWDGEAIIECVSGCANPIRAKDRRGARLLAVRDGQYKLVLDFQAVSEELFDLRADPREMSPLPVTTARPVRRRLLERAGKHIADSLQFRDIGLRVQLALRSMLLDSGEQT